ncbi:acyl-CoA dehydrogenase [Pseudooceanicola atlanticus]|uniref:Acyl-CoA dehydrogenase/oxidase C-terminal domain-containing protein n=1 Tax=Pseudooceanicola atlanticus TaxID=1461694 RepID=A0A0A0EFH1_9RHOB|nr:acyl-CoA dehydrogenase [Pseudooceanicola atlanticus]KGM49154.1 hypothetical protein ATO9_10810 [Pseudooceanicola atlanticus]
MSMDLTPPEEMRQILDAAQSMLDSHYPVSRLREGASADDPTPLAEFGTFILALPEDQGGAGFSIVEEAQLHVALGRHLLSPAILAGAVALRLAREVGQDDLADRIGAGDAALTLGIASDGTVTLIDPDGADQALIRDAEGLALAPLEGHEITPVSGLGQSRQVAELALTPANSGRGSAAVTHLHGLLCAAQLLGVTQGARDLAVDYAKTREQFGRPIGSFQAIKHHCANMSIQAEMLSAQLDMAAIALRDGAEDAAFQIAALTRLAPRIALETARLGIQIHGGIGFSAEADAHHYLKQAHLLGLCLGRADLLALPAPMAPTRKETT